MTSSENRETVSEALEQARFEQETKDRDREIKLKEREVGLKESESQKPPWHDPVLVGLFAAFLALLGNIYSSVSNARLAREIASRNALQQLITDTMVRSPERAEVILRTLLTTKVIEDKDRVISDALASGLFRVAAQPPSNTPPPPPPESMIAQQVITVAHGGYARDSDPQCAAFNDPTSAQTMLEKQSTITSPSSDSGPTCVAVKVPIPTGKTVARVVVEAREQGQNWRPCPTPDGLWKVCDIGWSAWNVAQADGSVIGIFKNWSHNRDREARIAVFGR